VAIEVTARQLMMEKIHSGGFVPRLYLKHIFLLMLMDEEMTNTPKKKKVLGQRLF
jgi:hypothetical protein